MARRVNFTYIYRPAPDEPEHSEPHFNALGLCVCSCALCTLSLLGTCVCLDCPCDGEGDRGSEHTPLIALFLGACHLWKHSPAAVRLAEEEDRHQWIEDVKRRLGLVTIEDRGAVVARGRQYPDGPLEPTRKTWP